MTEKLDDILHKFEEITRQLSEQDAASDPERFRVLMKERALLEQASADLRQRFDDVILLSFPGDELAMGGCMAAGREFFHINSHGGAEPCPFSPYSDINVRDTSLRAALKSPLFLALQEEGVLKEDHPGGCVLHEKRAQVEKIMAESVHH